MCACGGGGDRGPENRGVGVGVGVIGWVRARACAHVHAGLLVYLAVTAYFKGHGRVSIRECVRLIVGVLCNYVLGELRRGWCRCLHKCRCISAW